MRPVQGGSGARAQCPRRLVMVQFVRQASWCPSMDSSERSGPELELDTLANQYAAATAAQWHWNEVALELRLTITRAKSEFWTR